MRDAVSLYGVRERNGENDYIYNRAVDFERGILIKNHSLAEHLIKFLIPLPFDALLGP
jgi:hypothetical protein